jgi:hypothetical protein
MEAMMRDRSSLTLYNSSINKWEEEEYIELYISKVRGGIIWWKI